MSCETESEWKTKQNTTLCSWSWVSLIDFFRVGKFAMKSIPFWDSEIFFAVLNWISNWKSMIKSPRREDFTLTMESLLYLSHLCKMCKSKIAQSRKAQKDFVQISIIFLLVTPRVLAGQQLEAFSRYPREIKNSTRDKLERERGLQTAVWLQFFFVRILTEIQIKMQCQKWQKLEEFLIESASFSRRCIIESRSCVEKWFKFGF